MAARRSVLPIGLEWVALMALAMLFTVAGIPLWARFIAGMAVAWLLLQMCLEALLGLRCPDCLERSLRHSPYAPVGMRYARCQSCGARWRRSVLGSWRDASDAKHDRYFEGRADADPWRGGPVFDAATLAEGTHGRLLQNKISRRRRSKPPRPIPGPTPGIGGPPDDPPRPTHDASTHPDAGTHAPVDRFDDGPGG
jgi:hypothetical protein